MSEGIAKSIAIAVTRMFHTKSGMRSIDMPGARSLAIVTMKLIAPAVVEIPRKTRPSVQKSIPVSGE